MGKVYRAESRSALGESSVPTMGSVTGRFSRESELHPAAHQILLEAFDKGWADPAKLHRPSRELAHLLDESKSIFASHLGVRPDSLSFLGEPDLGFHLGISGLMSRADSSGGLRSDGRLFYPATSRQEVFAVASSISPQGDPQGDPQGEPQGESPPFNPLNPLTVDLEGSWEMPAGSSRDLLIWPIANNETGARSPSADGFLGPIFVDATTHPSVALPERWTTSLWDSRSWAGPAGLGIFAVKDPSIWSNPLPHNDHRVVPGGFNPALVIASALALEAYTADYKRSLETIKTLNMTVRQFLSSQMSDVDLASPIDGLPHLLSFSFLYIDAEQLVDRLERRAISVDSGSACISANLEASHVLAAMGRLTQGNVRITLKPEHTESDIAHLLTALKEEVDLLRGAN